MLLITQRQEERLRAYLPDSAQRLMRGSDVSPIIDALSDLVLSLLDDGDEPTPRSREVERFMDDLLWQNFHPDDFPVEEGKTIPN